MNNCKGHTVYMKPFCMLTLFGKQKVTFKKGFTTPDKTIYLSE